MLGDVVATLAQLIWRELLQQVVGVQRQGSIPAGRAPKRRYVGPQARNPDRDPRSLLRRRAQCRIDLKVLAIVLDVLAAPERHQKLERPVEPRGHVTRRCRLSERRHVALLAEPDAEDEPAAGEAVERRRLL